MKIVIIKICLFFYFCCMNHEMSHEISFSSSKKRHVIIDTERKALRDYYFDLINEKPPHKFLRQCFNEKFQHAVFQSIISKSLFARFAHLNTQLVLREKHKRQRVSHWFDLEDVFFEWQQRMMFKNIIVTNDIFREMTSVFWNFFFNISTLNRSSFLVIGWSISKIDITSRNIFDTMKWKQLIKRL